MTLQDEIALTRKAIKHAEAINMSAPNRMPIFFGTISNLLWLQERLDFLLVAEQGQKFPTCTTCKGTMYCDKGDWRCAACGGLGYTIKDV